MPGGGPRVLQRTDVRRQALRRLQERRAVRGGRLHVPEPVRGQGLVLRRGRGGRGLRERRRAPGSYRAARRGGEGGARARERAAVGSERAAASLDPAARSCAAVMSRGVLKVRSCGACRTNSDCGAQASNCEQKLDPTTPLPGHTQGGAKDG